MKTRCQTRATMKDGAVSSFGRLVLDAALTVWGFPPKLEAERSNDAATDTIAGPPKVSRAGVASQCQRDQGLPPKAMIQLKDSATESFNSKWKIDPYTGEIWRPSPGL